QFAHAHCKARRTNKVSTARKYTSLKNVDELLESQFGIIRFKDSDSDINFYTGFPNYKTLLACYNLLNPGENGENIVYVNRATKDLEFSASSNKLDLTVDPSTQEKKDCEEIRKLLSSKDHSGEAVKMRDIPCKKLLVERTLEKFE
ncbi:hypothetical protein pdam_00024395, partial [Pocillopora damicornis]